MNVKFTLAGATLAALLAGTAAQAQDVIGYITKSATNAGWMMINQGAADAAEEEGVKLVSVGPSFQGDLSSQLEVFENLVAQGAKAIGVAPVDSSGIAPAVNDAMSAGIPIIAIDTGVSGAEVTSFVATDNYAVAKEQGNAAAALVADGDAVIYVTGNQAQSTGQERRNGFVEAFSAARPNSEIVEVPTEWDSAQAQEGVEAILNARDDIKISTGPRTPSSPWTKAGSTPTPPRCCTRWAIRASKPPRPPRVVKRSAPGSTPAISW